MPGFLDKSAPSIAAEYSRYIDGDLLGKLIAKNFLMNQLGIKKDLIDIPLARHGSPAKKYVRSGRVVEDLGDGSVETKQGLVTFEIKLARINIANRSLGRTEKDWAFSYILNSPNRKIKKYDVLIAIGLHTVGLEHEDYWKELRTLKATLAKEGRKVVLEAKPHEARFLTVCNFFIMPRRKAPNYFRLHLGPVKRSKYAEYLACGDNRDRCRKIWRNALLAIRR